MPYCGYDAIRTWPIFNMHVQESPANLRGAMNHFCATTIAVALMAFPLAQNAPEPPSKDIIDRLAETTVLVLSGEGGGRLSSTSTGVIVRPNGVILVAYHAIKDAKEVQVRLKTGDIYDQVVLIGTDERRDVAALKIT